MRDIRYDIFKDILSGSVTAVICADGAGILAGAGSALDHAARLGLTVVHFLKDGASVHPGDEIARFRGNPMQIAVAEDVLMGCMAKSSGIATATRRCVTMAGDIRVVCGSWKKMPANIKETLRNAIAVGGGDVRISREPFIYLDKNYIRMLGGIKKSLEAVSQFPDHQKVIQIKGREKDIASEAIEAARCSAHIIFIDSGNPEDLKTVSRGLRSNGLREHVKIAFGGNIRIDSIATLKTMDVDILDIGKEIIDAPLLDLKMEVMDIRESILGAG